MTETIPGCSQGWAAGSGDQFRKALELMGPGTTIIRAWFFQRFVTVHGRRDWSVFDKTLNEARSHGVKVIAVLADEWSYCEGPTKGAKWYAHGYRTSTLPGNTVSYATYVRQIVARYRNDPTIAIWEMANEPAVPVSSTDLACSPNANSLMLNWAQDTSTSIKTLDRVHLVSLGSSGGRVCGLDGAAFARVSAFPSIDVCSYHDYSTDSSGISELVASRIAQCQALHKPIYAGEVGVERQPQDPGSRGLAFTKKVSAQLSAGSVGIVAWNWDSRGSNFDYQIGPNDPVVAALLSQR